MVLDVWGELHSLWLLQSCLQVWSLNLGLERDEPSGFLGDMS